MAAVAVAKLVTLKKRREFDRVRGGGRFATQAFVLEGKVRPADAGEGRVAVSGARFGFTITKKLGGAVVRNRMRRRLRAAITRALALGAVDAGYDYVVVARDGAATLPFDELARSIEVAFAKVHAPGGQAPRRASRPPRGGATARKPAVGGEP